MTRNTVEKIRFVFFKDYLNSHICSPQMCILVFLHQKKNINEGYIFLDINKSILPTG